MGTESSCRQDRQDSFGGCLVMGIQINLFDVVNYFGTLGRFYMAFE